MSLDQGRKINDLTHKVFTMQNEIDSLERKIRTLERDSHPSVDIVDRIMQTFLEGGFDDIMRQRLQLPPYNE